jgi:uncharacterized protein YqjF (DUF2071 family)
MLQVWRCLTFLHWRYDPAVIAATLPKNLTLDTFDGSAWIGLVPFVLARVQLYTLPVLPWISEFPETNVRTYVRDANGNRGVYFYTLEASRLLAVLAARSWYHLPYRWASMQVNRAGAEIEYRSKRNPIFGQGNADIRIQIGAPLEANDLANFLTARFRLYTSHKNRIAYAQIEHDPWPLHKAKLMNLNETLIANSGIAAPTGEPLVYYSEKLSVKAGALQWI